MRKQEILDRLNNLTAFVDGKDGDKGDFDALKEAMKFIENNMLESKIDESIIEEEILKVGENEKNCLCCIHLDNEKIDEMFVDCTQGYTEFKGDWCKSNYFCCAHVLKMKETK